MFKMGPITLEHPVLLLLFIKYYYYYYKCPDNFEQTRSLADRRCQINAAKKAATNAFNILQC